MKNITFIFAKKAVSALVLSLVSGASQAANYDIQNQDLWAPLQEEDRFKLDSMFEIDESASFFESFPATEQDLKQSNYQAVLDLIKQNKLDQADAKVNDLLQQFPNEAKFYNLQAFVKIQQNNKAAATASLQQALKRDPNNLATLQGLALLAIETNDFKSANGFIDKIIATDVKAVNAYLMKAEIAYRQNNLADVENVLSIALSKAQGNSNLEIKVTDRLLKLHLLKQEPLKMLKLAQALQQRYPENAQVLPLLAKAQLFNRQSDEAEQTLRKIISQDRQDALHRLLLANLLMNQSHGARNKQAAQLIDEVLAADPDNAGALTLNTISLIKAERFEEALELADQIDKNQPQSAIGKMLKADIYLAQRQVDQALAYNQQAYRIQPNTKLLGQIAQLLIAQGKTKEAIELLSSELDKNPQDLASRFLLANVYVNRQDYKKAAHQYQIILKDNPDSPIMLNNLAMVYYHQNNPEALRLAERAYKGAPDSAAIADTYGVVLLQQERHQEALEVLSKAVGLAPGSDEIRLHLAKAYKANGNKQKSIELLEEIVKSSTDLAQKQAASDLLGELK